MKNDAQRKRSTVQEIDYRIRNDAKSKYNALSETYSGMLKYLEFLEHGAKAKKIKWADVATMQEAVNRLQEAAAMLGAIEEMGLDETEVEVDSDEARESFRRRVATFNSAK